MLLITSVADAPDILDMAALEPWTLRVFPVGPVLPEAGADLLLDSAARISGGAGTSLEFLHAARVTPGVKEQIESLVRAAGRTPLSIMCVRNTHAL